ncbi:MAG: hypothetical protein QW065_03320 [Acidilobaceae archaeon]
MLRVKDVVEDQKLLGVLLVFYFLTLVILLSTAPRESVEHQKLEVDDAEWLVILFTSSGCRLCDKIKPYWNELSIAPNVKTLELSLNDPKAFQIAISYGVKGTPTILVLDRELREVSRLEWNALQNVRSSAELTKIIEESLKPKDEERSLEPSAFSLVLYPILGVAIAFSPCSAPLIALYASASIASRPGVSTALKCALLASAGLATLGLIVMFSVALLTNFIEVLPKALGFLLIALGLVVVTLRETGWYLTKVQVRSFEIACLGFGVIASQCSLPLLIGALLSPTALNSLALGLVAFFLLVSGLAIALAIVVYTSGRVAGMIYKLVGAENLARLSGAIMIALGVYASLMG